jgi:hypothetical protein
VARESAAIDNDLNLRPIPDDRRVAVQADGDRARLEDQVPQSSRGERAEVLLFGQHLTLGRDQLKLIGVQTPGRIEVSPYQRNDPVAFGAPNDLSIPPGLVRSAVGHAAEYPRRVMRPAGAEVCRYRRVVARIEAASGLRYGSVAPSWVSRPSWS